MKVVFKRAVSGILPVCLVWLFAACVTNCASHAEEVSAVAHDVGFSHLQSGEESDCCSITDNQSLLPERVGVSVPTLNDVDGHFCVTTGQNTSHFSSPVFLSSSSPPPKFSGTLRI